MKSHEGLMRVVRANERQNLAKERADEQGPKEKEDSKEDTNEEGDRKRQKSPDTSNSATGSGLSPEDRNKQVEEKKGKEKQAGGDEEMSQDNKGDEV